MKKIVIFGVGQIAAVVGYYLAKKYEIAAYTVDKSYLVKKPAIGVDLTKPICDFEQLELFYPPLEYSIFVAIGYQQMNKFREKILRLVMAKGYDVVSYNGCDSVVTSSCSIGKNVFIMDGTNIHPNVIIQDNVFIFSGSVIGHHSVVEAGTWVTSGSMVGGGSRIGKSSFLGLGCIVSNNIVVGDNNFIGMGAKINKHTAANQVFITESTELFKLSTNHFERLSGFLK
jgi:acetyltransferase-like isoleucine patch superfamily enzyme